MEELTSKHTDRDTDAHNDLHPITLEEGLMEWRGGIRSILIFDIHIEGGYFFLII